MSRETGTCPQIRRPPAARQKVRLARIAAPLVLLAACLSPSAPALAHSYLKKSTPANKQHVKAPPKEILLRFGAGIEAKYSEASLEDESGKSIAANIKVAEKELKLENVPDLPPARYLVKYKVLSEDGHTIKGQFEFYVDKP